MLTPNFQDCFAACCTTFFGTTRPSCPVPSDFWPATTRPLCKPVLSPEIQASLRNPVSIVQQDYDHWVGSRGKSVGMHVVCHQKGGCPANDPSLRFDSELLKCHNCMITFADHPSFECLCQITTPKPDQLLTQLKVIIAIIQFLNTYLG